VDECKPLLHGRIEHVTNGTAEAHGCSAHVNFAPGAANGVTREEYPPTVNDPRAAALASAVAASMLGADQVWPGVIVIEFPTSVCSGHQKLRIVQATTSEFWISSK
jgi:hypothetical protein